MDDQDEQLILDKIADDFLMQCRRGQTPSVEQYASEYPELQQQIRDVLGTLLFIEEHHESNESELSLKGGFDANLESEPTIDDFRIIRIAGRGGMGVVYEAEQISLARKVAAGSKRGRTFSKRSTICSGTASFEHRASL